MCKWPKSVRKPPLRGGTDGSSGVYYFLQAKGQRGFITGTVTDSGSAAFTGALVKTDTGSLVDLSANTGKYLLAAPVATFIATATDLYKGDEITATGAIATANQSVTVDLRILMIPPTVTAITPANGSVNVQPTAPVVITFSKTMDKTTITNTALVVRDAANNAVPGVITFNLDNTAVTFYPSDAFKQETKYSVTIAATVKDIQGYPLGQDIVSTFTVRKTTPPPMPPAGSITATFPNADGFITVTATQGSAEVGNTVLLINDTTGEITSITPQTNGSFTGKIRGQLGDEIKVVLMDYSGNQTTISYLTFKGPDGSYLVTAKGGKVEGEGGSLLEIPEGALVGPVIIKVTALQEANLPSPLQAPGKYLGAVNIDTGGVPFSKEVHLSIPVPDGFDSRTPVFVTKPGEVFNADGTVEKVYEVIDSTKIINARITTASPPFDGVMGIGAYVFTAFPEVTVGIVSGYTYQEMNDQPGFQGTPDRSVEIPTTDAAGNFVYKYDRPIQGAVIRTPAAWNYVSYTNRNGFYAGFTTLYGNVGGTDLEYKVTATHPLTMRRETITGYLNGNNNIITNLNFKLADKATIQPDKTAPVIELSVLTAAGQSPDKRIALGAMPVDTALDMHLSIIDESAVISSVTINYQSADGSSTKTDSASIALSGKTLLSAQTSDKPAIWRYAYQVKFPDWISTAVPSTIFKPAQPGIYQMLVEAADTFNNKSPKKNFTVRVVTAESIPGAIDGPPMVDYVTPREGEADLLTDTRVDAWFSEPVDNVNSSTFKLIDNSTGLAVPATITASFEGTRMRATLTPKTNLAYDRSYQIVITTGIVDVTPNSSAANAILPLVAAYSSSFTTKRPSAYDLDIADQFKGGRDIALYNSVNGSSYAYVTAGDQGWRVVDVTMPESPQLAYKVSADCDTVNDKFCRSIPIYANFRGVAVHPDPNRALMAMTDNYFWPDGNHFGYIRFYDLNASEIDPPIVGREKLAEAYSGIPGRIALWGDYAYVATSAAALQVISISAAINNVKTGQSTTDGASFVGVYDCIGQGYGSPNDIVVYGPGKALLTTNPGYLVVLDINNPTPVETGRLSPAELTALRVAAVSDYGYSDTDGNQRTIDLAVTGGGGRIKTVDVTNPYAPKMLATTKDSMDNEVVSYPYDITLNQKTGIAIVTTLSAIQVIDIKDPNNPRLINSITQLLDTSGATSTPAMVQIGSIPAMVESGGWLYMADQNKGIRTMNLGEMIKSQCNPDNPCDP